MPRSVRGTEVAMKFNGIGHIGMMIRELQPALDFYCGKLGFRQITDNRATGSDHVSYFLQNGGIILELVTDPANRAPVPGVIDHISFFVDNVEEAMAELKKKGIEFETEDILFDPYLYEHGEHFIMFHGPNGERLQLEHIDM